MVRSQLVDGAAAFGAATLPGHPVLNSADEDGTERDDTSQHTRAYPVARHLDEPVGPQVESQYRARSGGRRGQHVIRLLEIEGQWLLDVDMLAGFGSRDEHVVVLRRRYRDERRNFRSGHARQRRQMQGGRRTPASHHADADRHAVILTSFDSTLHLS